MLRKSSGIPVTQSDTNALWHSASSMKYHRDFFGRIYRMNFTRIRQFKRDGVLELGCYIESKIMID